MPTLNSYPHVLPDQCKRFFSECRVGTSGVSICEDVSPIRCVMISTLSSSITCSGSAIIKVCFGFDLSSSSFKYSSVIGRGYLSQE